jgi:hypothetical protein
LRGEMLMCRPDDVNEGLKVRSPFLGTSVWSSCPSVFFVRVSVSARGSFSARRGWDLWKHRVKEITWPILAADSSIHQFVKGFSWSRHRPASQLADLCGRRALCDTLQIVARKTQERNSCPINSVPCLPERLDSCPVMNVRSVHPFAFSRNGRLVS